MNEVAKFEVQKKKLEGICDENNLVYSFKKDRYPITLTVKTTDGLDGQMTMLENAEEDGYRSADARLTFAYEDGDIDIRFSETFTISEALLNKLKIIFKKMHSFWLQYFFRDIMERGTLSAQNMPVIDDDGDDLPDDAEPLEPFDDDEDAEPVDADDPLITEAARIVRHENKATVSLLQRHLQIGYAKASRLMDDLEALGVVGPFNGSDPREVLPYDEPVEDAADDEGGDSDADEA